MSNPTLPYTSTTSKKADALSRSYCHTNPATSGHWTYTYMHRNSSAVDCYTINFAAYYCKSLFSWHLQQATITSVELLGCGLYDIKTKQNIQYCTWNNLKILRPRSATISNKVSNCVPSVVSLQIQVTHSLIEDM